MREATRNYSAPKSAIFDSGLITKEHLKSVFRYGVIFCVGALTFYFLVGAPRLKFSVNPARPHRLRSGSGFLPRDRPCTVIRPCNIKLIADLDKLSKVEGTDKLTFRTYMMDLFLTEKARDVYEVKFNDHPAELRGKHNEAGRGMELSELVLYEGRLLCFDDRTGITYELTKDNKLVPRHVLAEGDGYSNKGMKIEWATIKDDELYVGSFGKEFTTPDGTKIVSENNFWIAIVDEYGNVRQVNWKDNYNLMRKAVKAEYPGYMIHEAINWSPAIERWIILPRRVSSQPYNEDLDLKRGSNIMMIANEDFSKIETRTVGEVVPERGFSSFKFVPGTNEQVNSNS
eukprot:GHVU01157273.1.p1 GENE.GHVU01157273.1~~GHVU01157273.1.p1  ORF type:complete len:362 (-),score=32.84 GHVU01157273.1:951-1979(-)